MVRLGVIYIDEYKIAKNEQIWVRRFDKKGLKAIITSNANREWYYLYLVTGDKISKTKHKARNPLELEVYIK